MICPQCATEMISVCPKCGKPVDVFSRIVGYLRPVACWNDGKKAEWNDRTPFHVCKEQLGDKKSPD